MKLNLDIIADNLDYRTRRVGPENRALLYRRPVFYESGGGWEKDRLYIAATNMLPRQLPEQAAVVCVGGRLPREWLSARRQILHIEEDVNLLRLMQDIFAIFDRFDDWEAKMRDIVENVDEIEMEQMLRLGADVFHKGISLSNHLLSTVFWVSIDKGQVTVGGTESTISAQYLEKIKEVCQTERKILHPYLTNMPGAEYNYYCKNLYYSDYFMGCISIGEGDVPFRESEFALMDYYFDYLGKLSLRYLQTAKRDTPPEIVLLQNLLEQRPVGMLQQALLTPVEGQYWVVFKLLADRSKRYLLQDYMCQLLCSVVPETFYAVNHNNEIYGLIRLKGSEPYGDVFPMLGDILKRMGYMCGLSNPFTDVREALPYIQQAAYAASQSEKGPGRPAPFFCFCDYILRYMLYECTGDMPKKSLYPKGLVYLKEHDRTKGSEYIKTLRTYLRVECSISHSAELLYVHRNSLIKRLENIRRLLQMDLDDPDVRLLLRICLRLDEEE